MQLWIQEPRSSRNKILSIHFKDHMEFESLVAHAPNIPQLFFEIATKEPSRPLYTSPIYNETSCAWQSRNYGEVAGRISRLSAYLKSLGVIAGSSVAIICGTRPEWMELDIAILSLGAITVSVYPSLPTSDVGFILYDSKATFVIAENEEQLNKLRELETTKTHIPAREDFPNEEVILSFPQIITIEDTTSHPRAVKLSHILENSGSSYELPTMPPSLNRDSVASLVYTSGTTGPSKGVIQTHGNHLANVYQSIKCGMFGIDGDVFLFLPLAHSFARLIGYLGFLTPAYLKFAGVADRKSSKVDLAKVTRELRDCNPNILPTVPRLFEKIKSTLEEASLKSGINALLLKMTLDAARHHHATVMENRSDTIINSLLYTLTGFIRNKVKTRIFGDSFRHAISGGAKLPSDVNSFFWSLGIKIYEGYGLTETCVATNVNTVEKNRIGSVGPALEGVVTKIADDGEILFKGPNITKGYWNRPLATKESWDEEGWFHTGDIGHITDDLLFITDRKKDLIVTAGGKKVPPQKIENLLMQSQYISQAVYCGDAKPFCVAMVTINGGILRDYLKTKGISSDGALHENECVKKLIEEVKEKVNAELPSFEAVKKIKILPDEFTVENGILTPTLKIKRKVVMARYKKEFEEMYQH